VVGAVDGKLIVRSSIGIGNSEGNGVFTIPKGPVRRRLQGLPHFVTVRGGEYCFMPGLRALRWLAHLGRDAEQTAQH
jgi:hypothetical protein